ncbi:hypothetical protein HO173_010251 [Letharia columbiana]|uniref:N-acetylglucosaminylphosphatidylinositol deacetylase n=1 Tax=Letharia columbiana TaxID=112416 RepID=A0A8H6FMZ5_9LECA|nr:uncharacterized protein HO173_010251 [Letharia columbiana]KAF6231499.1 hypothetical protein HO173_010251 [Letharia columbiana]
MQLYLALAIPVLLATAWLYTAQVTRTSLPSLRNKRICLLIAHPDDEAMFFSPTLLALTAPETGNHVKILCLSSGNADGLGEIRKQELAASGAMLGLRSASDVLVINDRKFPDSMTTTWPADKIAQILSSAFSPVSNSTKKNSPSDEPTSTIDTLITFDARGISSHLNHISLYHGARHWLSSLMAGKSGWKCPVELYTLTTTNILRKYISAFDAPVTMVLGGWRAAGKAQRKGKEEPPSLLFVSDFGQWRRGQSAMVKAHKSQMRWFRWGWIGIGRYMVVNDLKREIIT